MKDILKATQKKFLLITALLVTFVVFCLWAAVQITAARTIGGEITKEGVHHTASSNQALSEYIKDQKAYEAHFISLANLTKQGDFDALQRIVLFTGAAVLIIGIGVSYVVSRILIKPVAEAYQSQERFLQDAAHELRNPLAVMSIALQKHTDTHPNKELLKIIRRQTKRLVSINEDLLFLERRTSGNVENNNVSELIADISEEIEPYAHKKNVTVRLTTHPDITLKIAAGDYVRAVKNILENAIKYSPEKSRVTITQKIVKNNVVVTISDSGIGIPVNELHLIGERFFRAKNAQEVDGTGLGIAIVKKILARNGGSFSIDSGPKGTTVTLTFKA